MGRTGRAARGEAAIDTSPEISDEWIGLRPGTDGLFIAAPIREPRVLPGSVDWPGQNGHHGNQRSEPGPLFRTKKYRRGDAMTRPETEVADRDPVIVVGVVFACATRFTRTHATAEGQAVRGRHAIGPCVESNRPTFG